jgi:hypothetical protein
MTIHWKVLEKHFLMVQLVSIQFILWETIHFLKFAQKTSVLKELALATVLPFTLRKGYFREIPNHNQFGDMFAGSSRWHARHNLPLMLNFHNLTILLTKPT